MVPITRHRLPRLPALLAPALGAFVFAACTPKAVVEVKPPEEPIVINLNVKIEHEIRVKVDKDLEQAFEQDQEIF